MNCFWLFARKPVGDTSHESVWPNFGEVKFTGACCPKARCGEMSLWPEPGSAEVPAIQVSGYSDLAYVVFYSLLPRRGLNEEIVYNLRILPSIACRGSARRH